MTKKFPKLIKIYQCSDLAILFCTCNQLIDKRISYNICKNTKTKDKDKIFSLEKENRLQEVVVGTYKWFLYKQCQYTVERHS